MRHNRAPVARAALPGVEAFTAQLKPSGTKVATATSAIDAQPLTASTP